MSSIRRVAITEPLVDVVDHSQVVTNNYLISVSVIIFEKEAYAYRNDFLEM